MALILMEKSDRSLHLSEGQAEIFVRGCYSDEPSIPSIGGIVICMLWLLPSRLQLQLDIQTNADTRQKWGG